MATLKNKSLKKSLSQQAEENACRIEHILDEDVFQGIQKFMKENLS